MAAKQTCSRRLKMQEVADRLRIPLSTFRRTYQHRFTDLRPKELQRVGTPVLISEDEVEVVESQGWAALENFQRRMSRK